MADAQDADPGRVPAEAARAIIEAGQRLDRLGYVPATAGNISMRLDSRRIAITRSGGHKGFLTEASLMVVGMLGQVFTPEAKPSAETELHCQIYREVKQAGAVLHGHSVAATVMSMVDPSPLLRISGYEVMKAFEGIRTHETTVDVPVFDNDQDIGRLAGRVTPALRDGLPLGYIIRGHGIYIWGPDMPTALARLEGLEFLLACEWERRKFGAKS